MTRPRTIREFIHSDRSRLSPDEYVDLVNRLSAVERQAPRRRRRLRHGNDLRLGRRTWLVIVIHLALFAEALSIGGSVAWAASDRSAQSAEAARTELETMRTKLERLQRRNDAQLAIRRARLDRDADIARNVLRGTWVQDGPGAEHRAIWYAAQIAANEPSGLDDVEYMRWLGDFIIEITADPDVDARIHACDYMMSTYGPYVIDGATTDAP